MTLALIIGAAGFADAATGGNFLATGELPAGTYHVSATAMLLASGTTPVYCRIAGAPANWGGGSGTN